MNNLGIALGAYTNEMNRQREQQRADAADQRQQQQFEALLGIIGINRHFGEVEPCHLAEQPAAQ